MGRGARKSGVRRQAGVWRVAGFAGASVVALAVATAQAAEPGLVLIDQGITDMDPLATSLRLLQPDLRQDLGFEHLYMDPANDNQLVRISGAMYAVSPHSAYWVTRKGGVYPAVAAGTVFYIGALPDEQPTPSNVSPHARSQSLCVSTPLNHPLGWAHPIAPPAKAIPATVEPEPVSVETAPEARVSVPAMAPVPAHDMSDPSYRVARLRQIAHAMNSGG